VGCIMKDLAQTAETVGRIVLFQRDKEPVFEDLLRAKKLDVLKVAQSFTSQSHGDSIRW
jgi:hypothetical protein